MENELLKIFDDDRNPIGEATREEVHKIGYWHETFHCWFYSKENEIDYLYFQLRSARKKDYPDLLDITAAGHILAHETVEDGIREVWEETGIKVSKSDLVPLGVIDYCAVQKDKDFIDKELANVFLFEFNHPLEAFELQKEEVTGMYKVPLNTFDDLWRGTIDEILIEGFEINETEERIMMSKMVSRDKFVPHENQYYEMILKLISSQYQSSILVKFNDHGKGAIG
jgi:isopentenyldiphosphate isomerase